MNCRNTCHPNRERGKKHQKQPSSKKKMRCSKQNINFHKKKNWSPTQAHFDNIYAREKRIARTNLRRSIEDLMKSRKIYEEYHGGDVCRDKSVKGIAKELMTTIEDISEKGRINEYQYIKTMNILMDLHNYHSGPFDNSFRSRPLGRSIGVMQATTNWRAFPLETNNIFG